MRKRRGECLEIYPEGEREGALKLQRAQGSSTLGGFEPRSLLLQGEHTLWERETSRNLTVSSEGGRDGRVCLGSGGASQRGKGGDLKGAT